MHIIGLVVGDPNPGIPSDTQCNKNPLFSGPNRSSGRAAFPWWRSQRFCRHSLNARFIIGPVSLLPCRTLAYETHRNRAMTRATTNLGGTASNVVVGKVAVSPDSLIQFHRLISFLVDSDLLIELIGMATLLVGVDL